MLNNRYRTNVEVDVQELGVTFVVTGGGTVYYRDRGAMRRADAIISRQGIHISHDGRELKLHNFDPKTNKFAYTLVEEKAEDDG